MYRPTVRYDDTFRYYVDALFQATDLDRNQIIRLALFTSAYSHTFKNIIKDHLKPDVPPPSPIWEQDFNQLWMVRDIKKEERGSEDVYVDERRESNLNKTVERTAEAKTKIEQTNSRRIRQIPVGTGRVRNTNGGIKITLV
ncbi:hypothetical protein ACSVDA_11025 [Cytobacillus sp. Hm23]